MIKTYKIHLSTMSQPGAILKDPRGGGKVFDGRNALDDALNYLEREKGEKVFSVTCIHAERQGEIYRIATKVV